MKFELKPRQGKAPEVGQKPPQLQFSDLAPDEIKTKLWEWGFSSFPGSREHKTLISVSSSRAMWLDENITPAHDDAFMPPSGGREFLHFHADGSLHAVVDNDVEDEIIKKGWGIRHMYYNKGVKEMLVYGPRNKEELETVKSIVNQSYRYAHGD